MAEAASSNAEDASRGRPYYEKLKADLRATIAKKRELDKNLAALEENIARAESAYLEETSVAGNIIRGFDNYIKASASTTTTTGGGTSTRRKGGITDQDRIFSRSSVSWCSRDNAANLSLPPSSVATPVDRGTPASTGPNKSKNKKKAAADKDDGNDSERPTKRSKVSWGRD